MRFARLMEGLGVSFMRSVMTLFAFLPILWTLSEKITELPLIGRVSHSLVWAAIVFALAGTVLMALVGFKLPGLEFQNQRVEAAFRKELVYGEDDRGRATPARFSTLFADVRQNYFRLYFHYMYFDVARYAYLQFGVLVPYIALGPTLVNGVITLGVMQQIVRGDRRDRLGCREGKSSGAMELGQPGEEQAAEERAQHPHRQQEGRTRKYPAPAVERDAAARHDHVDMGTVTPTIP